MKLIDADEVIDSIKRLHCEPCKERFNVSPWRCAFCPSDNVREYFENAQTVDAEPVKHGHWVKHDNSLWSCSQCDEAISMRRYMENELRYCSWCGAKMDEEVKTDEGVSQD